jgi:hypothetical protein
MLAAFSLLFGLLAVAPTGLIAWGWRWGWLAGLLAQIPWTAYDLLTGQPGFLLITAVSVPVYWAGWQRSRHPETLTVTAGDVEHHAWCAACQSPTRLRIPLALAGQPAGTLEVCPGCGTGHDRAYAGVTPAPKGPRTLPHPVAALAKAAHGYACRRSGVPALECAHGDCPWPGLWRHVLELDGEDGTWRYVFCSLRHCRRWAAEHGILS